MKKIILSVAVLTALAFGVSCNEGTTAEKTNLTKEIKFKKDGTLTLRKVETDSVVATLDIEISDDDYKTQIGLMYRQSMENRQAMLFIFPDEGIRTFYMKNTEFSIDILYFDKNKRLLNYHSKAEPYNEKSLPSAAPAMYVLEVNAGLADQWGLDTGDTFEFTRQ